MDCSLVANGNSAESFKKTSEINLFATDGHRWDTDLAEVEGGRAIDSGSFRELTSMGPGCS